MRNGKLKTLYGLYKILGRDLFLELAKNYSDHVCDCIDRTLDEMESRWYDAAQTMTEAEKMVSDYNSGLLAGYDYEIATDVANKLNMEVLA